MNSEIEIIKLMVENINKMHLEYSSNWIKNMKQSPINLKKFQIRNAFGEDSKVKGDFFQYINNYCTSLNDIEFTKEYAVLESFDFRSRIKDPVSRMSKILTYKDGKNEGGKVAIKKCLNDLYGFRVFLNTVEHTDSFITNLCEVLDLFDVKVHNSCKGQYKATHIYFHNSSNLFFPWELQIWNNADKEANIQSHKEHKQAYLKWMELYNDKDMVEREGN